MSGIKSDKSFDGISNFILNAISKALGDLNTATMATVTSISEDKTKLNVTIDSDKLELPDVPFFSLQGGGSFLQFPVSIGDKCLLVIAKPTVDQWLLGESEFSFADDFDINNAFAFVGINDDTNAITIPDYTDFKVDTLKIRNDSEELITVLSDTEQLISDMNDEISKITVTVTAGSSAGTYPINQIAIFTQLKADADDLKARLDTFKV